MSRSRRGFIRKLWKVPSWMLEARGDYLNDKGDGFIKKLAWVRSAAGLVVLAGVALTDPGFTESSPELTPITGHDSPHVAAFSKLADSWLYSILYWPSDIAAMYPRVRGTGRDSSAIPSTAAHAAPMCRPLIAAALFAGLMAVIVGTADLISWMIGPHDSRIRRGFQGRRPLPGSSWRWD